MEQEEETAGAGVMLESPCSLMLYIIRSCAQCLGCSSITSPTEEPHSQPQDPVIEDGNDHADAVLNLSL